MLNRLLRSLRVSKPTYQPITPLHPRRMVLTVACLDAIRSSLAPKIKVRHESIVYLVGQTDGRTSTILAVARPSATTTRDSFYVDERAMKPVVEAATRAGLQVVGQLHTHPQRAYHSDGDVVGSLIRYNGFVSIVLPDYGTRLPCLDGAAFFMYSTDSHGFVRLCQADLTVLPAFLK